MAFVKKISEESVNKEDIDTFILNNIKEMNELYNNETDIEQKNKILQFLDIINFKKVIDRYGDIFSNNILIEHLLKYKPNTELISGGVKNIHSSSRKNKKKIMQRGGNDYGVLTHNRTDFTEENITRLRNLCDHIIKKYNNELQKFSTVKYPLTNPDFIGYISRTDSSFEEKYNKLRHILIVNIETGNCVCFYEYIMKNIFNVDFQELDISMSKEIKTKIINGYKYISEMRKIAIYNNFYIFDIEMDTMILDSEVIYIFKQYDEKITPQFNSNISALKSATFQSVVYKKTINQQRLNEIDFFINLNNKYQILANKIKDTFINYQTHKTFLSRERYENFEKILNNILMIEGAAALCFGAASCTISPSLGTMGFLASATILAISASNKSKYLDSREITRHIHEPTMIKDYFLNDIYLPLKESDEDYLKIGLDLLFNRKVEISSKDVLNINTLYLDIINQNQYKNDYDGKIDILLDIDEIKKELNYDKELTQSVLSSMRNIMQDGTIDQNKVRAIAHESIRPFEKQVKLVSLLTKVDESEVRQILASKPTKGSMIEDFGLALTQRTITLPIEFDASSLVEVVVDKPKSELRHRVSKAGKIRKNYRSKKLRKRNN